MCVGTRERSVRVATQLYGLGTMNIASFRKKTFGLILPKYGFRVQVRSWEDVLGTQNCPTQMLASHHCVLRPNLIKNMFNTCIYTRTHTSIHLSIQSQHHSSQNTYPSLKQKRVKHKGNPSIHLTYEKPCSTSTTRQQAYHHSKANILQTLIMHLSMFHHIIKVKP